MKKVILCEIIERSISEPVIFDTKEQAQAEMYKRFKETTGMTDEEFEKRDYDSYESFCGENEAYCISANHDNCDWSIFTIDDTPKGADDPQIKGKILTTGLQFRATDKFGVQHTYQFLGVRFQYDSYICLWNLDSNTLTVVEPEWFRQRIITIIG